MRALRYQVTLCLMKLKQSYTMEAAEAESKVTPIFIET